MSGKLGHDLKVEIGLSNLNVPSIRTFLACYQGLVAKLTTAILIRIILQEYLLARLSFLVQLTRH